MGLEQVFVVVLLVIQLLRVLKFLLHDVFLVLFCLDYQLVLTPQLLKLLISLGEYHLTALEFDSG